MLVSVIIDNFNYEQYIELAIKSVLNQTYTNFELIIVDDGSNDNSKQIIEQYAKIDNRIRPFFKQNGGQASAFNLGVKNAKGEIICFLDSDDEFIENKIEEVVKIYKNGFEYIVNQCDYNIGVFKYSGYNLFLVYYLTYFVGNVTSSISISKKLANKIFPIKNEDFFRIRADDVIVFSSAMFSEYYFCDKILTKYRIHGNNLYMSNKKEYTISYRYNRDIQLHNLKKEILKTLDISNRFFRNAYLLYLEFLTHHNKDIFLKKLYLRILWCEMNIPFIQKIKYTYKIIKD